MVNIHNRNEPSSILIFPYLLMNSSDSQKLQYHLQQISSLLYQNTPPDQLSCALDIETTVRQHLLEHIAPSLCEFFFTKENLPQSNKVEPENSKLV